MTALISGRHTLFSRNPQLSPISEQPLPLEAGETLAVPSGHMVGVETGTEGPNGEIRNYRAYVVNALDDLTITGPAFVTSPRRDAFEGVLREERGWVRKQMMKMGGQILFIGFMLMLIAEALTDAMRPYHHGIIVAVFLAAAVGVSLFARKRLSPKVLEREQTS